MISIASQYFSIVLICNAMCTENGCHRSPIVLTLIVRLLLFLFFLVGDSIFVVLNIVGGFVITIWHGFRLGFAIYCDVRHVCSAILGYSINNTRSNERNWFSRIQNRTKRRKKCGAKCRRMTDGTMSMSLTHESLSDAARAHRTHLHRVCAPIGKTQNSIKEIVEKNQMHWMDVEYNSFYSIIIRCHFDCEHCAFWLHSFLVVNPIESF